MPEFRMPEFRIKHEETWLSGNTFGLALLALT